MEQPYTAEQVQALLYEAGRALMALRVPGCWPSAIRSGMPECLRDAEDLRYAEAEFTPAQPSPRQVSAMDRSLSWIRLLPGQTEVEINVRKLVWARCLVSPRTDRPIYSWKRLGDMVGCTENTAKTRWLRALDLITVALNRPGYCAKSGGVIPKPDTVQWTRRPSRIKPTWAVLEVA
jgi:hypothetical protein